MVVMQLCRDAALMEFICCVIAAPRNSVEQFFKNRSEVLVSMEKLQI